MDRLGPRGRSWQARFVAGDLDEILAAFVRLVEGHDEAAEDDAAEGEDNFRCVACQGCSRCRFCTACQACEDCNYCDACLECHGCTQSRECHGCVEVSHSSYSADCEKCSYVTLCYDCEGCVHCFGCVGLSGEEFCVLNERYARKEYFALVSKLRAELDVRSTEGWRPPWREEEEATLTDPPPAPTPEIPPPPALPPMSSLDDPWLSFDAESDAPAPAQRTEPGVGPLPDHGPTRPYPVVEQASRRAVEELAEAGPSLRAARRPPRRRTPDD